MGYVLAIAALAVVAVFSFRKEARAAVAPYAPASFAVLPATDDNRLRVRTGVEPGYAGAAVLFLDPMSETSVIGDVTVNVSFSGKAAVITSAPEKLAAFVGQTYLIG